MERTELQALLGGKPAASAVRAPTPEPADVDGAFLIDTALPSPSRFRSALAALGPTPAPVPVSGSTIDPLPPAAPRAPAPRYAPADSLWSAPRPLAPAVPPAPAASLPPPPVEAAPPTPPPPPAETPRPRISTASSPESRARAVRAKMYRLLDQATPRLQRYALEHCEGEPSREQRQKLRDLLQWVFEKEGYRIMPGAPTPYRIGSRAIQGRIDLMVQAIDGRYLLALETDWTKKSASVYKLSHWAAQKVPVAWVVGADCTRTQLKTWRHFADEVLGGRTQDWLPILHVEHGWLPES